MADPHLVYVAVLDTENAIKSPYHYYASIPVQWQSDFVVESLEKKLRSMVLGAKTSESEHMFFFQLDHPTPVNSAKECRELYSTAFPDYNSLNNNALSYSERETINLAEIEDKMPKVLALVALWIQPLPTSPSTRPILDSFGEDVYDREAIARAAQHRPSPSIGARNTELLYFQLPECPDAAYNYRPPELAPPPLAIYNPAFARFRREMVIPSEDIEFSQSELTQASHVVDVSLRLYPDKNARLNALRDTFFVQGAPLWTSILVDLNNSFVLPDGCFPLVGPNAHRIFPSLGEVTNGGGEGGSDPSDKVQSMYIQIVSSEQYSSVRRVSCCPAFLVSLSGYVLSIWGAVFADRFFFERLALLYVGPQPPTSYSSDRPRESDMAFGILQTAKLIRSLDNCLGDLIAHYNDLKLPSPYTVGADSLDRHLESSRINDQIATHFIHWTTFISEGKEHHLVYGQRLGRYMNSAVFRARMSSKSGDKEEHCDVVVKFTHRYGKAGQAPTLYHCEFEEMVGMWVVVMSFVEGDVSRGLKKGQSQALARAVDLLHVNDLVFGDLRRPNVIATKPDSISLIDFEWCGPCHDVRDGDKVICRRIRYPADISMSRTIDWAPGVGPKQVIMKEHDEYQLKKLCP